MKKVFILIFALLVSVPHAGLLAQHPDEVSVTDTFNVNPQNDYKISSLNIIPFSEKIFINGILLNRGNYSITYSTGRFSISDSSKFKLHDPLIIIYNTVKLELLTEYRKRRLTVVYDDLKSDSVFVSKIDKNAFSTESIFGKDIQKSGALIRGFTVGTNSEFQLNSGLRLQLAGRLSEDLEIVAALSDENTPIQPEGNTETLEELDKVFIEVKHKNATGTFGDYELNTSRSEFSQITRKLQGLKGDFTFDNHTGSVLVAGSRGKFNTLQFNGLDGNQGPYRLTGVNNEREIIVIAGSEKVFLDGLELKRGENNDYIIDYSISEIIFTPKRIITSASRISIDYEYTDQQFRRNFSGADYQTSLLNNSLTIGASFFREADDQDNPIEISLLDSDFEILRIAGNDRTLASRSGVTLAPPDSLGNISGVYSRVDTTINMEPYTFYVYSPGNSSSIYNVTFSYVGDKKGDYIKESLGKYKFAGIDNGNYLPVVFLPMPELKQVGSFFVNADLFEGSKLNIELSGSSWDRNRFSGLDDDQNTGYARKLELLFSPRRIEIGTLSLGKVGFGLKDRFIQGRYSSLDRIDDVEFKRHYNLSAAPNSDQNLREINLDLIPAENISLISKYGYIKQGDRFESDRINSVMKIGDGSNFSAEYNLDYVNSKNDDISTDWNRQNGSGYYSFGFIKPGFNFIYENKNDFFNDSLLATSLKYVETAPFVELSPLNAIDIRALYSYREESFPLNRTMVLQSKTDMKQIQISLKGIKEVSSNINITYRNKKYTDDFKQIGYTDNETVLFLSQNRFNFWSSFITGELFYQASTEQSARLEKVFVKVPIGTGNYIYLGDLDNNGIAEENEFQLTSYDGEFIVITTPTDQLFPVIDLKTNTRWKIDFNRIINGEDLLSRILKAVSTETSWRIEENSRDNETDKIYLIHLSSFLNDSTTVRGSQLFQNDINLFQFNNEFSIRIRYLQRRNLNQYAAGLEKGFFRERSVRLRLKLVEGINNQTEFTNQIDNLLSPPSSNRAREVYRNDVVTEFTYRPANSIEAGLKVQVARSEDKYPYKTSVVDQNSIVLRINVSLANLGRIRFETERTELTGKDLTGNLPFEITRGNVIGKNYFWRVFFDYKIASYVQTSFSYDGRIHGGGRVIHTMRAEARAYF